MVVVLLLCSLLWEKQPRLALPVGEDWVVGTVSWAAEFAVVAAAALTAASPSAGAGALQSFARAVTVALVALVA